MKNKLINKKVVNSIGIGVLAFATSCTPVLAAGTTGFYGKDERRGETGITECAGE